jgi:hypothetical protein
VSILSILVLLIVAGILVWAVQTYLPIAQPFKGIAIFIIIVIACVMLLRAAGISL